MSLQIRWTDRALKDVQRLDRHTRQRITAAVEKLADLERGDVRRLQGSMDDMLRLRVGDWRILFSREGDGDLLIRRVLPRGGAYRP